MTYNEGIPVSQFTEKFLESRSDDFRVDMIRELMFGNDIGGIFKNRTITLVDNDNKPMDIVIRKACVLDTMMYLKTSGDSIKKDIESNIMRIATLRNNNEGIRGALPPIKNVWLFVFTYDDEDIKVNAYSNPNSQDIGDVLRTDKQIIMTGFVLEYPTVDEGMPLPEGFPPEVFEWTFISPIIEDHLVEYNKMAAAFEAKRLEKMFFLDFSEGLNNIKTGIDSGDISVK